MRVAVAGGTGVAGRQVVRALRDAGHEAVPLARSTGVDLTTGAGLDAALDGVQAVVDASGPSTASAKAATRFFETATQHLLAAQQRAGCSHHVVLSIAGSDRVGLGYYRAKQAQEKAASAGPIPVSILRTTQFHEFAAQIVDRFMGPIALVPSMAAQPVAAREVGEALAALAVGPAGGLRPEMGGPQPERLADMARAILRARGSRRVVLPVRLPGRAGSALAGGALRQQGPGATSGRQTFEDWLAGPDAAEYRAR